jgi:ABC-type multidrug transport system ATPase subunit
VILLDEPTAGMSTQRDRRASCDLIRDVTVGKTLLTVEHDMGVVFGLADTIAVLVYGEVIAFDTPERVRANARVQEAYLGSVLAEPSGRAARGSRQEPACERSTTSTPSTARATCCMACNFAVGAGRDRRRCSGATASGRSTTVKAIMGLVDGTRVECAGSGQETPRPQGLRDRARRHRLRAREPRHLPRRSPCTRT